MKNEIETSKSSFKSVFIYSARPISIIRSLLLYLLHNPYIQLEGCSLHWRGTFK